MSIITRAGLLIGGLAITATVVAAAPSGAQQEDLDCGDPGTSHNMPVEAGDPHDLDDNNDGIGCEDPSAFGSGGMTDSDATPQAAPPAEPVEGEPNFTG